MKEIAMKKTAKQLLAHGKTATRYSHFGLAAGLLLLAGPSHAGMFDSVSTVFCSVIGSLVGPKSTILSMVFVALTAVALVMWWLNENKEGMLVWVLRSGVAVGLLINLFTLPPLLGMAPLGCTG